MNRLKRIAVALKGATTIVHPQELGFGGMSMPRTRYNYAREVGDGRGSSVVVAPIKWLQRALTEPILRVRRPTGPDGQLDPVQSHPLLDLLANPNPWYDWTKLLQATIADRETDGNAYWFKVRNGIGTPIELYWLPSRLVTPKRADGSTDFITHYEYSPKGQPIHLAVDDIVHFRQGMDPKNPLKGESPLKGLLREVFTDDEAANFTASLLRNFGVPGVIISPASGDEGMWTGPEDAKRTKRMFQQSTTGDARGGAIVLTSPTRVEQFGYNPQQMDLRALRRLPEERVSAVMGIPAIVVGFGAGLERSTFSNYAEAREAAYDNKVLPDCREIASEIWHQLGRDFESDLGSAVLDFDMTNVRALQDDEDKLASRMDVGVRGGWVLVSEAREAVGLPVDDNHRIFLRPISALEIPADQSIEDTQAQQAPPPPGGDTTPPPADPEADPGQTDTMTPAKAMDVLKEGRVLSGANAARIQAALDALTELVNAATPPVDDPEQVTEDTRDMATA